MAIWMTARGAGLSALVLLTISTCLGALLHGGGRPLPRLIVQYVHRVVGALGIGVLLLHVATILADSYAHVGAVGAVVPFTSSYRATWVGLGTIAAYTMLLVGVLGAARGRLAASPRAAALWRPLHALAYAGWAVAMVHGFSSGTDTSVGWVRLLYLLCGAAVVGSVVARVVDQPAPEPVPAGWLSAGSPVPPLRPAPLARHQPDTPRELAAQELLDVTR
jgi:sulfoxide reductase heme-binding subunit YedZ